jgi:hypothetical protein
MAICVIAVEGVAPCQCFSPAGNQTTSPGRISSIGPSQHCAHPRPEVTIKGLAKWMSMPGGAGTRLERDAGAHSACWMGSLKQWFNDDIAGKPLGGSFAGRLRTTSFDFHRLPFRCFVSLADAGQINPTRWSEKGLLGELSAARADYLRRTSSREIYGS